MDDRLSLLWASDGSEYCLSTAETIRQLLLPVAEQLSVVSVAPLNANRAALKRLFGSGEEGREQEQRKAEEAALAGIEALGPLDIPVRHAVRWGSAAAEIVKEATERGSDLIVVGAKPFNAFRRAILEDTALAVLKSTHRSVLLARPPCTETLRAIVLLCNSPRWLPAAVDLVGRLDLAGKTKVYLTSFIEPTEAATGLFFSYREYRRLRSEALSMIDHQMIEGLLDQAADTLMSHGYETDVVIGDGSADQGLSRLVEDVSGGAVVVGATPFATGFFSSTADALNAALRAPCSVLVAR